MRRSRRCWPADPLVGAWLARFFPVGVGVALRRGGGGACWQSVSGLPLYPPSAAVSIISVAFYGRVGCGGLELYKICPTWDAGAVAGAPQGRRAGSR